MTMYGKYRCKSVVCLWDKRQQNSDIQNTFNFFNMSGIINQHKWTVKLNNMLVDKSLILLWSLNNSSLITHSGADGRIVG
jgi:hypothetical protein